MEKRLPSIMNAQFQKKFVPDNILVNMGIFPLDSFRITIAKTASCFIKGTKILMADGSEKSIETITPATPSNPDGGDVLISVDGVKTYVVALVGGPRPEPLKRIIARSVAPEFPNKKFKAIVSIGHTIAVDHSRMVLAWFLREGDYICTNYGMAIIESIENFSYKGEVWNLFLASEHFVYNVLPTLTTDRLYYYITNSSLGLTPKQHLIFGGGVLSGDLYVQIYASELAHLGYGLENFV